MTRKCPLCQMPMREVVKPIIELEMTGKIVFYAGRQFECTNPTCSRQTWVEQGSNRDLVPLD